jgi:hypothetical protein
MTLAPVAFELYSGFRSAAATMPDGVALLDASARAQLLAHAGVRHAAQMDLSVVYAVLAARPALNSNDEAVGILAINGPWNVAAAVDIDRRAREAGARFINPMRFPATLVSHVPTRVAQELGCKQFAYAVGHHRAAFADAILLASRLVDAGHAEAVLVIATCHGAAPLARIAELARLPHPLLDVSLCARVGKPTGNGIPLLLSWEDSRSEKPAGALEDPSGSPEAYVWRGEPLMAAVAVRAAEVARSMQKALLSQNGDDIPAGTETGPHWSIMRGQCLKGGAGSNNCGHHIEVDGQ